MSAYFASRPTGLFGKPGQPAPAGADVVKVAPAKVVANPRGFVAAVAPATTKLFPETPTKVVQVRAHTRTVPVKTPKSAPVVTATPQAKTTPVVTQSVRPANVSSVQRFVPHFRGEPVAGQVGAFKNVDGTWVNPGTRAQPGAYIAERPYYTDKNTLRVKAGPGGQESTQWNAAQVAQAKKMQIANYGKPGYIFRSALPGGLDESGTTSVAKALRRSADVASNILPGGGVGEAAGILGWGAKAIRDLRGAKDVAEAAPVAKAAIETAPAVTEPVTKAVPESGSYVLHDRPQPVTRKALPKGPGYPKGTLFHGSPEGHIENINALHHTKAWREGPGFYATTDPVKAMKYARGQTAGAARQGGPGALNIIKLKPGAKVLNMDTAPPEFWHGLAEKITGDKVDPATYATWASDITPGKGGASEGVLNRQRLMHYLTGYEEMPKTDAYYAIEEALHEQGIQATLHHENGVPVHIIKDENAIERVGTQVVGPKRGGPTPVMGAVAEGPRGATMAKAPVNIEGNLAVKPAVAPPTVPLPRGVVGPVAAHTTEEGAAVRGALKGAPNVRAAQATDFSAQRRARFTKTDSIFRDTSIPVDERQAYGMSALKGSLDRPVFTGFKKMTPETVTNIKAQIMEHPTLRTGQKVKLLTSLDRGVAGIVPTAGEHKLFTQVFGKETALGIAQAAKTGRWKNIVANVINVPRTMQSTLDMSAFLRQGAVALARHPVITGGNFKTLVHTFASNEAALKVESDIASHPNYPLMQQGKVAFTGSGDLQPQEEQFGANMLENLGGNKNPIHWSSRSYSAFLNKTRADIFNHMLDVAHTQGQNIHDEKLLKDLGNMVNVFTGRGSLPGDWERAAKVFNGIFFSPRLMASRLQVLGQPFNPALHPFVRRQYQRAFAQTFGALVSVLGLAKLNGLNVGTDPTSADFGKIKFGKTRVDLGAGFLQYAHLAGQLLTGRSTSSTSGKVSHIYSGKAFQRSAHDVLSGFFEGKLSPPLAAANDVFKQQTNFGPFNIWQELINHLTPLSSQDIYGVATNRSKGPLGAAEVAGAGALSIFGGGVQTYGPKTPKATPGQAGYFSNSSGGGDGSPYFSSPSSSGGSGYFGR